MKKLFFALLMIVTAGTYAQTTNTVADHVNAKQSLTVNKKKITEIINDTTAVADSAALASWFAIKKLVTARVGTGGGGGGTITATDSSFILTAGGTKINAKWWYNVKDFGAVGDGVTSDVAAIQSAIDYAYANGGGNVYFPNGVYIIDNNPVRMPDSIQLTCQICIPFTRWNVDSSEFRTIQLVGQTPASAETQALASFSTPVNGAVLKSTFIATVDAPYGNPQSVVGFVGTNETGLFESLSYTTTVIRDLSVLVSTKDDDGVEVQNKLSGVNFSQFATGRLEGNVRIRTTSPQTTQLDPIPNSYGFISPTVSNHGNTFNDNLSVFGFYKGASLAEHVTFQNLNTGANIYALEVLPFYAVWIDHFTEENNTNGVLLQDNAVLTIGAYESESYTSSATWYQKQYDFVESSPDASALVSIQAGVWNSAGVARNPTIGGDSIHFRLQNDRYGNSYIPLVTNTSVAGLVYNQWKYDSTANKLKRWDGDSWEDFGVGSSSLTVGTTPISGGTDGRVLRNNAGTLGEYSITGTGNVVMNAAPAFTGAVKFADGTSGSPSITATSNTATGISWFNGAGGAGDQLKISNSNAGATLAIQNSNATGFSGIEYLNNAGALVTFTGQNNSTNEYGFNNVGASGTIAFKISSTYAFVINNDRTITIGTLAGTGSRTVLADASGVLSAPVSDRTVKKNIYSINNALDKLMRLRPVTFDYIDGWKRYGQGTQIGFIAQEINDVLPNSTFVTPTTGKMGYNSQDLIPLTIKALQEAVLRIEALENEIKSMRK